jgi:hypothetical protein
MRDRRPDANVRPLLVRDLDLADPVDVVFDRILDRDDVLLVGVDLARDA